MKQHETRKPRNRPKKVCDATVEKETSEEGFGSKKNVIDSDQWREHTRITIGVAFGHWRAVCVTALTSKMGRLNFLQLPLSMIMLLYIWD